MQKKIRELKDILQKAGFIHHSTKGSHTRLVHPLLKNEPITITGKDEDKIKTYMAKDVHRALIEIAIEHGGMSEEDATHFIEKTMMKEQKRYLRDVY